MTNHLQQPAARMGEGRGEQIVHRNRDNETRGQQDAGLADRSGTARRRIGGYIGDRKEDWRI
jgi:hypothetical protein